MLRMRGDTQHDGKELAGPIAVQAKQPSIRAGPEATAAVFIKTVHPISGGLVAHWKSREARAGIAVWVKSEDASAIGKYPISTVSGFEQPIDVWVRQALLLRVVGEPIAVKAAQAERGTEP